MGRWGWDAADRGARPWVIMGIVDVLTSTQGPCVSTFSLIELARRYLTPGAPTTTTPLHTVLRERLTDPRDPRGVRYPLSCLVSVLVAGVACGYTSPLAIAGAAAGWDQDVLAGHGCWRSPTTGLLLAPSISTLTRLPALLDADDMEAALSAWLAPAALEAQATTSAAAQAGTGRQTQNKTQRRRRPPAAQALRETRDDGWVRAAPGHPWCDPELTGDPGHVPARPAVAVDGKERKRAKAGGKAKVHLLAAITHVRGLVIGQDRVAKAGKANETSHFRPLLEPLPLEGVVVTADALHTTRANAQFLRQGKHAHYLLPVLGNQPRLFAALDDLDWHNTPIAAATVDTARGRIETRTLRVLPVPDDLDFPDARQAVLIERYVTVKNNGAWVMRNCEALLYLTSLTDTQTSPQDLLACVRGHWRVEGLHWLRDVIWKEDTSLLRTGNAPQVMSAITNLVISLFRIRGVTRYTAETRRNAQNPSRVLQLLTLSPGQIL
jgi:predicted transposase YbfD/YdcC